MLPASFVYDLQRRRGRSLRVSCLVHPRGPEIGFQQVHLLGFWKWLFLVHPVTKSKVRITTEAFRPIGAA